jgi:hypothetical protein
MRFCVIRAETGLSVVPESAWPMYQARGCVRVSEWMDDTAQVNVADYTDAPDLDAPPEPEPTKAPAKTSKEK